MKARSSHQSAASTTSCISSTFDVADGHGADLAGRAAASLPLQRCVRSPAAAALDEPLATAAQPRGVARERLARRGDGAGRLRRSGPAERAPDIDEVPGAENLAQAIVGVGQMADPADRATPRSSSSADSAAAARARWRPSAGR